LFAAGALVLASLVPASAQQAADPQNTIFLDTKDGRVTIRLRPDLAPKHVEQIKALTKRGFYDGLVFHRVIDGFMAQTGDPTGTGMGGSELPDVEAEFNSETFQPGAVGAARSQDPNSFNSQFFITTGDASFLDGQYTVFGKVVSGMEAVNTLEKGPKEQNGQVANPDKIVEAKIEYK
jgi:peptidylprolyl isomerase